MLSVVQYFIGNLIIAFESTLTSRNHIVYVNGEGRVVLIYPVRIGSQHQREDTIFPVVEQRDESV